ncbi:MAG TPA: YqaA family protein [Allosphingosinicella sp.]|jgi:membrane protein YqaA with SNARE-associated domain|nr:YqaA family protein [Allosphingosinicella sp.]
MFRALYDWTLRLAAHRHALRWMAVIAFCESSFFPIPPDAMVVPMVLARRDQAYRIAAVCTLASVLGGMLGYAIGYFLWDNVGQPLAHFYGMTEGVEGFRQKFDEWGAAIILIKGLTPIPFKVVTIASGFAHFNFPLFVLCAAITRAARFFAIAWLLKRYGEPMQAFIERRLNLVAWAFLILLAAGFAAVMLI